MNVGNNGVLTVTRPLNPCTIQTTGNAVFAASGNAILDLNVEKCIVMVITIANFLFTKKKVTYGGIHFQSVPCPRSKIVGKTPY